MLSKHLSKNAKEKKPNSERKEAQLKWRATFTNTLPDVPADPKFLPCGAPDFKRMAFYTNNAMAKYDTHSMDFGALMGIRIETADPEFYAVDPANPPELHPSDRYLLEDETVQKKEVNKRARVHKQSVPFMRKAVVIPSFKHMGVNKQRTETTIGYGMAKKGVNPSEVLYRNRLEQIAAIEKTFEDVKKPVTKHYQKENVTAVEEFLLLPDFINFVHDLTEVEFDTDPTPLSVNEGLRKLSLENSHLYSVGEGNQIGHFIPTAETLQRILEEKDSDSNNECSAPLEHVLNRDYLYKSDEKPVENRDFYFRRDDDNFVYNPISNRVMATRIRRKAGEKMHPWSMELTRSKPTEDIFKKQRQRAERLLYNSPDYEEDEDDEDMVTDVSDQPYNEPPAPKPASSSSSDESSDEDSSSRSASSTPSPERSDKRQTSGADEASDHEQKSEKSAEESVQEHENARLFEEELAAGSESHDYPDTCATFGKQVEQTKVYVKGEPMDDGHFGCKQETPMEEGQPEHEPAVPYNIDRPELYVKSEAGHEEHPAAGVNTARNVKMEPASPSRNTM